jgi:hypothetical protein
MGSISDRIIESALHDEIKDLTARITELECELNEMASVLGEAEVTIRALSVKLAAHMQANSILISSLKAKGGVQ